MLQRHGFKINLDGKIRSADVLLSYPGVTIERLSNVWPDLASLTPGVVEQLEIDGLYRGYVVRQDADISAYRRDEALKLPDSLDYAGVGSLSAETRQKLTDARPATLGAAARISGVTPAALVALLRFVKGSGSGARR
jgi:tRNA uridine 5-carboxymethylaminomethyl modification enzyme